MEGKTVARKPKHAGEVMIDWITIVKRSQDSVQEIPAISSDLRVKYGMIHDFILSPVRSVQGLIDF